MAKKLTAMENADLAMKKHDTVKVYVGHTFTHDDCAELVAPLSQPEIDLIHKAVKFITGNPTVKCVSLDISNAHICNDLEKVIGEDNCEEHEMNGWSVIPLDKYNELYAECFTHSDEMCRLNVYVTDEGHISVDLVVGYGSDDTEMAANIFNGNRF